MHQKPKNFNSILVRSQLVVLCNSDISYFKNLKCSHIEDKSQVVHAIAFKILTLGNRTNSIPVLRHLVLWVIFKCFHFTTDMTWTCLCFHSWIDICAGKVLGICVHKLSSNSPIAHNVMGSRSIVQDYDSKLGTLLLFPKKRLLSFCKQGHVFC